MDIFRLLEDYLECTYGYTNVDITYFDKEGSLLNFNYGNSQRVEDLKINIWDVFEFYLSKK